MTVCGFGAGLPQENWLITQHISRVLPGEQRLRKVTAWLNVTVNGCDANNNCRQSFDVFIWQTSTINTTAARNTDNYQMVGRVAPDIIDGRGSSTHYVEIDLDSDSGDGFYLAVVDFGTCVSITHLIVLYYVCPEETSERISRPETIEYESLGDSVIQVNGECVGNSSPQLGSSPVLQCGNMGQWQVVIPCLCNPGHELNDMCTGMTLNVCTRLTYSESSLSK